jgi:PmbA protein
MLEEHEAQALCQQVLQRCGSQPAEVLLQFVDRALTRFANNTIHQNVAERDLSLRLRLFAGKRAGMASTNRTDAAALDETVARAQANADASPENQDDPGLPGPAEYAPLAAFDEATASCSPEQRARQVGEVCRLAQVKSLNASGAFSTGYAGMAVANSRGVFAYHRASRADFQTVIMAPDSSGHAHASGWRVADIPVISLGQEAIAKASRGRDPQLLEAGEYPVVFDPYVTQDLLSMLGRSGMGAQSVLEGRSWMNDRIGQSLLAPAVSIWDDGLALDSLPVPFDFEGVPKQRVDLVKAGLVQGPVYDRATALKAGKTSTGHAMPANMRMFGPLPSNLFLAPGAASLDELIRSTQHGLYVTRFWYTRLVHPRDCVVTGMTRDGVFLVENGELTRPLKNLRFTQSYVQALAAVEAVGRETRLLASDYGNLAVRVPALKIARFNFTGSTV